MGFTRSTTNTTVHQNMPDYPTNEGYTTSQLKTAFDAPATGLKTDLNGLMTEIEASDAAASIGAAILDGTDTSEANVQAKLEKLQTELQGIALGDIPDGSITETKLDSTYASSLAKKDGTVQTNLNADTLDGFHFVQITKLINGKGHSKGTFTVSYNGTNTENPEVEVGFQPSFMLYASQDSEMSTISGFHAFGIVVGTKALYYDEGSNRWRAYTATMTEDGIILKGFTVKYGDATYTHNMMYVAFR